MLPEKEATPMKKKMRAVVALVLVLCMLLTGCAGVDFLGFFAQLTDLLLGNVLTPLDQMVYTRPDMEYLQKVIDESCAKVKDTKRFNDLVSLIYTAYAPLDEFATAYALANIHYSKDLTDTYWAEEYAFCSENAGIAQAALDKFYRALAQSSHREALEAEEYFGPGFFDDYVGDSFYDQVFTGLLTREAELENAYYALWQEVGDMDVTSESFYSRYGQEMEVLYVDLIHVRQDMAAYLGYASYPEFAYDYYYGRDYTCADTASYLADIRAELVPLYRQLCQEGLDVQLLASDEKAALAYVERMANAMGGTVQQAYEDMLQYELYDIAYGEHKFAASFEVFINSYYTPYIFMNPTLTERDKLTLAHEFGHFCADYAAGGSAAGVDVAEVFSQGMEYLSLLYAQPSQDLLKMKMADSLCVFAEQAAYASFEQQVYALEEPTVESVRAVFEAVGNAYGFDTLGFDSRMYVQVTHFFTNPMYVMGYVVSNDLALQLYQMEQAEAGSGVAALEEGFYTMESGILAFAEENGLESPFAQGRMQKIKELLRTVLQ